MEFIRTPFSFWYEFVFLLLFCDGMLAFIQCHFLIRFSAMKSRLSYYLIYFGISYLLLGAGLFLPIPQNVSTLIGIIVLYFFVNLILKQNKMTSAIIASLVVTANVLVESVVIPLSGLLSSSLEVNSIILNVAEGIIMLLMTYMVLRFFAARYNLKTNEKSKYLPILVLPLLFICIAMRSLIAFQYPAIFKNYQMVYTATTMEDFQFLALAATAFLCVCGSLFAYERVIGYFETEREKVILEAQLSMQKNYVAEAKSRYADTREFRHDFKNHLIVLSGLIENNETEKAKNYLKRFERISQKMSFVVSTGNTVIDALLGEKLAYAKKSDIHVKLDLAIPPSVKIDDFDLCAVFFNALDNAIKACNSVNGKDRTLDITAKQDKNFFLIDISNTYERGHVHKGTGIGLSVMNMVVEKYHGAVEISEEGNIFRISMILPFKKE